ncbi:MAG TPA: hypothetical protein VJB63_00200 [Patescibacteria group bacterium]|nr:hypothetical protein [Patescibacteria group bacterium]
MQLTTSYFSNLSHVPSFWKGTARVLDLFGNLDVYNYSNNEEEADFNALKRDWEIVGQDLFSAIKQYESIIGKSNNLLQK